MNNIIKAITISCTLMLALFPSTVATPISSPATEKVVESDPTIREVGQKLKNRPLSEFYKAVGIVFSRINVQYPESITRQDIENQLWFIYYIASASLFTPEYSPDTEYDLDVLDNNDITYKKYSIWHLISLANDTSIQNNTFKNRINALAKLSCQYATKILQDLRNNYDPLLVEKLDKLRKAKGNELATAHKENWRVYLATQRVLDEYSPTPSPLPEKYTAEHAKWSEHASRECSTKIRTVGNKVQMAKNRNEAIAHAIRGVEKDVVAILLNYCPNKPQEVLRYLKLAGYAKEEIPALLNRTVGRNPKTEFLYKVLLPTKKKK